MQRFLPKQQIWDMMWFRDSACGVSLVKNIPEGESFKIQDKDGSMREFKIARRLEEGKGMLDQGVA